MAEKETHLHLSRRERQIMDVIYSSGSATVQEVVGKKVITEFIKGEVDHLGIGIKYALPSNEIPPHE